MLPLGIARIGKPVFRDIDRHMIFLELLQNLIDTFRIDLPSDIRRFFIFVFVEPPIDTIVSVMVESDKIGLCHRAVQEIKITEAINKIFQEVVDPPARRFEPAHDLLPRRRAIPALFF